MAISRYSYSSDLDEAEIEAEEAILGYLRQFQGKPVEMWEMLNKLCDRDHWSVNRQEKKFYLSQLRRLAREKKVKRYRTMRFRTKIRISEAYV